MRVGPMRQGTLASGYGTGFRRPQHCIRHSPCAGVSVRHMACAGYITNDAVSPFDGAKEFLDSVVRQS